MKMSNVEDCVKELAKLEDITQSEANARFNDCMIVLADAIKKGGVSVRHMFTIRKVMRAGRKGEVKGQEFYSRDKYILKIKAGKKLSEIMNTGEFD